MTLAAALAVVIALPDEAEAVEGEGLVDLLDEAGVGGDEPGEAAGGDGFGGGAELGDHALEDAVDLADGAVVEADLDVVRGVGADDLGGLFDFDAGEAGGAGEERVGGDADAGSDGAAEKLALGGDYIERRSRADVDDDGGAA